MHLHLLKIINFKFASKFQLKTAQLDTQQKGNVHAHVCAIYEKILKSSHKALP